jgi:hypothetical protein
VNLRLIVTILVIARANMCAGSKADPGEGDQGMHHRRIGFTGFW